MSETIAFKKKNPKVVISTKFGDITIRFFTDVAPRHVENFLNLAKIGFYDGTTFHRVIPGFIIQGGDPLSKETDRSLHGQGGPGFSLNPEPSDQPHRRGTVSMAKMPRNEDRTRDVTDNGSQFFICVQDNSSLDRTYSAFGKVMKGMDVVDKIVAIPCDERDNPLEPVVMKIKEVAE
ncbi:peptidylprolyl isomerase [Candidatus Nitronereus thalassa]|uniref:Peptidyl-prolyl cis-trans isomerase n=1 Tax=Candidatus Nitronereus thalassa TaxID=3020898 RepID=A0ABU3K6T8_9BACT|nr:peptidylprolyl isomerase [Candidatus Nitronereus thalassa]MDT7042067.1 peptidylprolyl isomerase [Candidatus Nitronereus thalassa]